MRALALDMGGTQIGCGVVEGDRLLAQMSIGAEDATGLADLLPVVADVLHTLLRETGTTAKDCADLTTGFRPHGAAVGTECATVNAFVRTERGV
jgi:glucokinase